MEDGDGHPDQGHCVDSCGTQRIREAGEYRFFFLTFLLHSKEYNNT